MKNEELRIKNGYPRKVGQNVNFKADFHAFTKLFVEIEMDKFLRRFLKNPCKSASSALSAFQH